MFETWEKLEPQQTEILFLRGVMYKNAAYYYRSIDDFRAYLRHYPNHYQARLFLADSLLGDARQAEAEVELEKCHELRPDDPDPLIGLATTNFDQRPEKAREMLNLALRLQPNSVSALLEMTKLDQQAGKYDDVVSRLEKILSIDPNNKQTHLKLGQAFRRKGDAARAVMHESRYEVLDKMEVDQQNLKRGMR